MEDGFVDIPEGKLYYVLSRPEKQTTEKRPLLYFLHAGVADHSQWDDQVQHFVDQGFTTLTTDSFGWGKSRGSEAYEESSPRPKIAQHEHAWAVLENAFKKHNVPKDHGAIIVGCSMNGATAIDFTLAYPDVVKGLVPVAGGLNGFDHPEPAEHEARLEAAIDSAIGSGDNEAGAQALTRYWLDGPNQTEGRVNGPTRERFLTWNRAIAKDCAKGVYAFSAPTKALEPRAAGRLADIKVPVAVAWGSFDEGATNAAMKHVHENTEYSVIKEFATAHLANVERPEEFNAWLEDWLKGIV